ncbi:hypothetical protein VD0001_g3240 [Verticillium dahliae]|nr:N amino acid transport system protein [Verticillium dahliae VDG2]PNH74295.1 hypothetical protein VD0001_g3240 [Verticillium dahliae]
MVSYLLLSGLVVLYCAVVAIRRVYFSPLSKFPGPTIAALTTWYAAYHDIVRGGQCTFVIEGMHRRYGPVVRIMPDVLQVNDPAFVDQLYAPQSSSHRRDKAWTVLNFFQTHYASISTGPQDLHRPRRAAMGRFFSQQKRFAQTETPFAINPALQAATKDVIQNYALGKGVKCLDQEDFNAAFFAAWQSWRPYLVYIASLASIVEHHGNSFPGDERREAKLNHNGGL